MALENDERQAFLAEPHIAGLSIEAGPDRAPLAVPMWYQYTPGGDIWFLTGTESRKMRLLRQAGRATILVERLTPTIRYVSVSGPVSRTVEGTKADIEELAARYLPPEQVGPYVEFATGDHGAQTKVFLTPKQWVASDLGSL
ncbi:hypothetical protein GOARA_042_00050 [Gordonia araii NBRC 100433]|uniref:Uncharacterized protein n=1 Tax=Gordonia araii NBRC 100433 TaxID=1073574 RepID=G7H0X3_9ACTN|nr:pyridoxamine 5'-phosphate oxidase family protein [Gordonia araii]NNG97294.1 pyridoxamine 5'-phosphate oxidase family protein [Gordonia araii NBRC 100433]GAB09498.1 hypothetical protein GOARA_042_00050 [Gordonia araii NBRC 100433]